MGFLKIAGTEVKVLDGPYVPMTPPPVWWAQYLAGSMWTLPTVIRVCDLWNPDGGHATRCDYPPLMILTLATGIMHSGAR